MYMFVQQDKLKSIADLKTFETKRDALEEQIKALEEQIQAIDTKETLLNNLQREVATNENSYSTYLQKAEQARVSKELDQQKIANISIIQKARAALKPHRPNKRRNMLVATILGFVTSIAYTLFVEYVILQSMSTPSEVNRRLNMSVLATVSRKKKM